MNHTWYRKQKQVTIRLVPRVRLQLLSSIYVMCVTPCTTEHICNNACPLCTVTPPCTKFQSRYCDTISSHQSIFATSLCSSLANFHTDLCTFCLIRNVHKIMNCVMYILNTYRTVYVLSRCVQSVKQLRTRISIVHVWHTCSRDLAGQQRKIYWVSPAVQNIRG